MSHDRRLLLIVGAGHDPGRSDHRNFGTVGEKRGVERLAKRHRIARHEDKLDVLPVAAGQIFQHRPALQAGVAAVLGKHQAIRGLPDRRGDHVADGDVARLLAEESDRQAAPLLGAVFGETGERALHLRLGLRIGKAQRRDVLENGLHEAAIGHQRQAMARDGAAFVRQRDLLIFDLEDAPLRGDLAGDFDLAADQRVEQRARRIECLGAERQIAKQLRQRRFAGQADGADGAFAVEYGQALENVVDLVEPNRKIDR